MSAMEYLAMSYFVVINRDSEQPKTIKQAPVQNCGAAWELMSRPADQRHEPRSVYCSTASCRQCAVLEVEIYDRSLQVIFY